MRRKPTDTKPDATLQPRWGPRFGYSVLTLMLAAATIWELATDEQVPWTACLGFGVGLVLTVKVWLDQVVIAGPVLYRQATLRWCIPVRADDVKEVTLYYEPGRIDLFRRTLTMITYDGRSQSFSIRWWQWSPLIAWLTKYCTRTENGEVVWAFKTDEKTRSRLEPYAEPHLAELP